MLNNFFQKTAYLAGSSLKSNYGKSIQKWPKGKFGDLVTKADYKAEKIIINAIKEKFPDHSILSEEAGLLKKKTDYLWIVDPLDGTKNFTNHIPLFGTTLALSYKGEIIEGVVYDPIHNEMFYAKKGKGAFLNGRRIKTSQKKEIKGLTGGVANVRTKTNQKKYNGFRNTFYNNSSSFKVFGSAVIDLCCVAAGRLDMFILGGVCPWDVAAGGLLVLEAGGKISTLNGKKWELLNNPQEIVVSGNKNLHSKILKIIK